MVLESLRILLFGMIGIFIVMGIIIGAITLLGRMGGDEQDE